MPESTSEFCLWESSKTAYFYDKDKKVLVQNHFVSFNNEVVEVEARTRLKTTILLKIAFSDEWLRKNKVFDIVFETKSVALSASYPVFFESINYNTYKLLHTGNLDGIKNDLHLRSILFNHIDLILESLKDPRYLNSDELKIKWVIDNFFKSFESTIPTISEIAKKLSMSESKFKYVFKNKMGVTYYHFYLNKSMEQALHWLLYENLSVKEISHKLGYSQPVKFIHQFKKTFGDTPLRYKMEQKRKPFST